MFRKTEEVRAAARLLILGLMALCACSPQKTNGTEPTSSPAAKAADGPFGLVFGEPLSALGPTSPESTPDIYDVLSPPKPDADFNLIAVVAHATTGVCEISAGQPLILGDLSGAKVKAAVDQLETVVSSKYGPPKQKFDVCRESASSCSQAWSEALANRNAVYGYVWFPAAPTKGGVWRIIADVAAHNALETRAALSYDGVNHAACDAAAAAAKNSSL